MISKRQLEWHGEPIGDSRDNLHGKHRSYYGGGKGGGDAPDYTPLAKASDHAVQVADKLGTAQQALAEKQYEVNRQIAVPVSQAQLALSKQQTAQGDDYFNYMKSYSRPVEQSLYYQSMGFTPDEIKQIESSRAQETNAFNTVQAAKQPITIAGMPGTAAVAGFTPLTYQQWAAQNPVQQQNNNIGIGALNNRIQAPSTADYQAYLQSHPSVQAQAATQGIQDQITPAQRDLLSTPTTDTLVSTLGAQAAQRQQDKEAAARAQLTGLNTNLANTIGESNVDVYRRNQANIDAETGQAVADSRAGYTSSLNTAIRQGLRYGMSPERIAAASSNLGTAQAQSEAAAANTTRNAAVNTMYGRDVGNATQLLAGGNASRNNQIQDNSIDTAKKLDVAGLYRGTPGASAGAYGLSLNAGNSAVQNNAQAGNALVQANQGAASTILNGTQQQISGLTGIVNAQTSINNANNDSGVWGALGQVGGMAASKFITSDENVKMKVKPINEKAALDGIKNTDVKSWQYDPSKVQGEDSKTHVGAMAQDLQKNLGNNVSNGKMVDLISAVGMNMAATKHLAKTVDKMKGGKK